jgi:hypothetical protein
MVLEKTIDTLWNMDAADRRTGLKYAVENKMDN